MPSEIIQITKPSLFICHFLKQEGQLGMPYYQCALDPNEPGTYSPSGDFVRFQVGASEINGWVRVEDIVIDEMLEVEEAVEKVA